MADVKFEFCKPLTYLRLRQNINKADICPVFFGQLFQAKFEELYSLFFLSVTSEKQVSRPKFRFSKPLSKNELIYDTTVQD